ncbi:MAG: hypothetical protein DI538_31515 [Azospira oryzae]|nr:MAG: hypothetical protein DI538_31515 [Azospira oryzae]
MPRRNRHRPRIDLLFCNFSTEYRLRRPDGSWIRVREDGRVIGREGGALGIKDYLEAKFIKVRI